MKRCGGLESGEGTVRLRESFRKHRVRVKRREKAAKTPPAAIMLVSRWRRCGGGSDGGGDMSRDGMMENGFGEI